MDPNIIFTFGVPALVIGSMVWRRLFPVGAIEATTSEPITEQAIAQATPDAPLSLATVLAHLNDKRDDVPHFFSIGGTGAGKSTFARVVLAPRVVRGEQFIIITGKRSSVFEDLPCIGRDSIGADGEIRFNAARQTFQALSRELARRDNTPIRQRAFTTLNILIDDATILLSELDEAAKFLRDAALLGRELDMRLIVQLGSLRVKELGWEGRGDLREHFAVVTYEKNLDGTRTTLLRPRFDDKNDIPFDASQVPHIAPRLKIDANRSWREPRDPNIELSDLLHTSMAGGNSGNHTSMPYQYGDGIPDMDAVNGDMADHTGMSDRDHAILAILRSNPGASKNKIYDAVGGDRNKVFMRIGELRSHTSN